MLTGGLAVGAFRMQSPMRMRPASAMAELAIGEGWAVLVMETCLSERGDRRATAPGRRRVEMKKKRRPRGTAA